MSAADGGSFKPQKVEPIDWSGHGIAADLRAENEQLRAAVERLSKDAERLDFIEQRIRKSYTGVSFDWAPSVEGDPSGHRMAWRHTIHDRKKTLRAAIDEAMSKTPND